MKFASIRPAGIATAILSVLVALVALIVAFLPPAVEATQYSYPSSAPVFTAYQLLYAIQHVVLAWGLLAVLWSGAAKGRLGTVGAWGSAVAAVLLAVVEAVAAGAATEPVDGTMSLTLNAVYGAVTIPLGVFLILLGVSVVRTMVWTGWNRWVLLISGIWVFIPLTPALAIDFTIARFALVVWVLLFASAGLALARRRASVS